MSVQCKAVVFDEFTNPEEATVNVVDLPDIGEGEVLVKVKGAGVNPVDAAIIHGHLDGFMEHDFPIIPGWDLAGVVEQTGYSARRFKTGDEVYAYARRPLVKWGTFAEYVVIPESYLAKKPESISFDGAAGIPLVGLTAWQSLHEAGNLEKGETVLILGGSGGVGSIAIQLAKAAGAKVIGVASEKNHAYMKELGADETADYRDADVGNAVLNTHPDGVDLIFDCTNGKTLQQSLKALKKDGKLVSILNTGEDLDESIDHQYVFVEPNSTQLEELRKLVDNGKLSVHVSNTYPLEKTGSALKQIQTLHTKGKIVIRP